MAEAIRTISVTAFTYYRWRKEFGGLKSDQVKRLKDLEKENEPLRKAVPDRTLEKLILREAASGQWPRVRRQGGAGLDHSGRRDCQDFRVRGGLNIRPPLPF